MPWTYLQRNQAQVLVPVVREMRSAYVRLGQLTQEAIGARDALQAAGHVEDAAGLTTLINQARAELRRTSEALSAWNTSGLPGASPANTPRWMAYLTPIHTIRWTSQVAEEYGPAVRRAIVGPVRERPTEPRAQQGMSEQDQLALAALALGGLLVLKKWKKRRRL